MPVDVVDDARASALEEPCAQCLYHAPRRRERSCIGRCSRKQRISQHRPYPCALSRLVATVPDDELSKARDVVATIQRRGEEARAAAAGEQAGEAEALRFLLSGPMVRPDQ